MGDNLTDFNEKTHPNYSFKDLVSTECYPTKSAINIDTTNQDFSLSVEDSWQMLDPFKPGGLPQKPLKRQGKSKKKKGNIQSECSDLINHVFFILYDSLDFRSKKKAKTHSLTDFYQKTQIRFRRINKQPNQKQFDKCKPHYNILTKSLEYDDKNELQELI